MMTGMAPGAETCFYVMNPLFGWMYEFALEILNTPNAPLVVSMSYGMYEFEQCSNQTGDGLGNCTYLHIPNSEVYMNRTNMEYIKLGLMGHTVIAASGDGGTAGGHLTWDNCEKMGPVFTASSPYLTTVGATSVEASSTRVTLGDDLPPICTNATYQCNCSTSTLEEPASLNNTAGFDTGGGFSWYHPMPDYQKSAVQGYINSGVKLPLKSLWNPNNRGYPDIGAVGENFCLLDPGQGCFLEGGTSASAPLIGGLVTLLNQDRLNSGKTPLGFINQIIYQLYDSDSTKYFNNNFSGVDNSGGCPLDHGFTATPGSWTPLTGVGSPKFNEIRNFVMTLP